MKKFLLTTFIFFASSLTLLSSSVSPARASAGNGAIPGIIGAFSDMATGHHISAGEEPEDPFLKDCVANMNNMYKYYIDCARDEGGVSYSPGILGTQANFVALLFDNQLSGQEYVADILDNIGVPTVSKAYAQGTGYNAMKPFLEFWKVFRNLAYSLYIIMFVVVGIMIMLRTKVNAQTIITIQTALPNLLITLLLITFSYAIVGFMIDLMYFAIYFVVYLIASVDIIDAPKAITRLMSHSAWSVVFEGRNSIVSAISGSLRGILGSLGTGGLGVVGDALGGFWMTSPFYLMVAVAFIIAMLKLMLALVKSYIMLVVQTVTAPLQILLNAMPGSKAFSEWLKKTASYLIPFPVAAAMFIFAGILVGDPTQATILNGQINGTPINLDTRDANPFGVNGSAAIYQNSNNIWLPPFTLTDTFKNSTINDANQSSANVLTVIGFVVFLMTPAAVKMAQDWLQVKESPYTAEALGNAMMGAKAGAILPNWGWKSYQEELAQKRSSKALGEVIGRTKNLHDEQPQRP